MTLCTRVRPLHRRRLATAFAVFAALSAPGIAQAAAASSQVTVPSEYVYQPSAGSYHDYCTMSPDRYLRASFQGPCARHDLCLQHRRRPLNACHKALGTDMATNCRYAYDSGATLSACLRISELYRAAVIVANPG